MVLWVVFHKQSKQAVRCNFPSKRSVAYEVFVIWIVFHIYFCMLICVAMLVGVFPSSMVVAFIRIFIIGHIPCRGWHWEGL